MPANDDSLEQCAHLVRVAKVLLQERGSAHTTLLDVAVQAQLSAQQVRSLFATRDELVRAVVLDYEKEVSELLDAWCSEHAEPKLRLRCLVRAPLDAVSLPMLFGGPHDSLCKELTSNSSVTALSSASARKVTLYLDWAAEQFAAVGCSNRKARALAEQLVCSLQGALLLADPVRPEELFVQLRRIERWLDDALDTAAC